MTRFHFPVCSRCGREFVARRSDARFCSSKCRTAAHREAHATTPARKFSIRDRLFRRMHDLRALAEKIERVTDDDRFAKWAKTEYGQESRRQLQVQVDWLMRTLARWPEPSQSKSSETASETDGPSERITLP